MTKIKLLKGWNGHHAGTVIEHPQNGAAALLIQRGIAEKVEDEKPKKIKLKAD